MPRSNRGLARRLDTQVKIWTPPSGEDVADLDEFGAVDMGDDNWDLVGEDWIGLATSPAAAQSKLAGQSASVATVTVELRRRDDLNIMQCLEIMNGPYTGEYLYIDSISFDDDPRTRLMSLVCRLTA